MTNIVSNINGQTIGGKNFDAPPVYAGSVRLASRITIAGGHTIKEIDLSNVLPNDGYDYECQFEVFFETTATNGASAYLFAVSGSNEKYYRHIGSVSNGTAVTNQECYSFTLPILSSSKIIKLGNDGNSTTNWVSLFLRSYKRLGKNGTESSYAKNITTPDNNLSIGGDVFYGYWQAAGDNVLVNRSIASGEQIRVDLSNVLPNDGYDYELNLSCTIWTDSTIHHTVELRCGSSMDSGYGIVCFAVTRQARYNVKAGNIIVPVSANNRTLIVSNNGNSTGTIGFLTIRARRRIGKNNDSLTYLRDVRTPEGLIPIGGSFSDGQWTPAWNTLFENRSFSSAGTYNFDVTDYLPKDNYQYEILFTMSGGCNQNNTLRTQINTGVAGNMGPYVRALTNHGQPDNKCGMIVVNNDNGTAHISLVVTDNGGGTNQNLYFSGYRRVGTNN